jgi:hypothetical protein
VGIDFGISEGIMLAMAAASAATTVMSASAQSQRASEQANLYRQQAQNARTLAQLKSDDINRKANAAIATQYAMAGAGGVTVDGSVLDAGAQTRANSARDIYNTQLYGQMQAQNDEQTASNYDEQASSLMTNAWIGAGLKTVGALAGPVLSNAMGYTADGMATGARLTNLTTQANNYAAAGVGAGGAPY